MEESVAEYATWKGIEKYEAEADRKSHFAEGDGTFDL